MKNAALAFKKVIGMDFTSVLDVGSGAGVHAQAFRDAGKQVTTIALHEADIVADFNHHDFAGQKFDCIWASHVLEHQRNVGEFLDKCYQSLNDNGILAVTVPPLRHGIVGGHLSLWNAGLLLYNLILAGFDCRRAAVKEYDYNISVIVRKVPARWNKDLKMDYGDIETLAHLFPLPVEHGFDGRLVEVNWNY